MSGFFQGCKDTGLWSRVKAGTAFKDLKKEVYLYKSSRGLLTFPTRLLETLVYSKVVLMLLRKMPAAARPVPQAAQPSELFFPKGHAVRPLIRYIYSTFNP